MNQPTPTPTPFDGYPEGGRSLLGKPRSGDSSARRGYGRDVLRYCRYQCAYCALDMTKFEGWLQLLVDHVVPQQMVALGFPGEWILDDHQRRRLLSSVQRPFQS